MKRLSKPTGVAAALLTLAVASPAAAVGATELSAPAPAAGIQAAELSAVAYRPYTSTVRWGANGDIPVAANYVGDATTDIGVFRPSNGQWWIRGMSALTWGTNGDVPVTADYNGDGKSEIAVYRPSNGQWWIRGRAAVTWGNPGDIPVAADYNGDRKADIAVFRPSTGQWLVRGQATTTWGRAGDVPAPANYLGDRRAEKTVFRPSTGQWFIPGAGAVTWGTTGDVPVPAGYTGSLASRAVWRPSNGGWYVYGSASRAFGVEGDIPQTGNFGGDARADRVVFRPSTGTWWLQTMELPPVPETAANGSTLGSIMRGAGIAMPNVATTDCLGVIAHAGDLAAKHADLSIMYGKCDASDYTIRWYKIRSGRVQATSYVRLVGSDPNNQTAYGNPAGFLAFTAPYDSYPTVLFDVLMYSTTLYYLQPGSSTASTAALASNPKWTDPGFVSSLWSPAKKATNPALSD